jgi:alpha-L-rhamnosidase
MRARARLFHVPAFGVLPLLLLAVGVVSSAAPGDFKLTNLRCEYGENPLGVDSTAPRLFWTVSSPIRGQRQTAYEILVASSPELLARNNGDLWDAGKVRSDATIQILYGGKPLRTSQQVFWKVRGWDKEGKVSAWSEPASWTMGVMSAADWQGSWIGANPGATKKEDPQSLILRRQFKVRPGLRRALVQVCGLGCYELSLNGRKVGDALFPPGWTKYDKTWLYDTYEITSQLRQGDNAVGLLLGNGMYNVVGGRYIKFTGSFGPLKAIAQLRLEYSDGSVDLISTDTDWRCAPGPITFGCVYGGEDHDARLEPPGWNQAGFDESKWHSALIVNGPGGTPKGFTCSAPPVGTFDVLSPIKVTQFKPGLIVYDLGQNASLMPRLKVSGTRGAIVKITPAELLGNDGLVDRSSCGGGRCYWQYTLTGGDVENWFPKFFYHGCRYVQIDLEAPPGDALPTVRSLEGVVVHSTSKPVGQFECSNQLFNRIHKLIRWAQRSNMVSLMTDCPHREKLGWLEEDHLNGPSLRYEFDLARLFAKVMNDMADSQLENGLVPDIAPEYVKFDGGFRDSPEWGSAYILVPWQQYEFTGDLELLRRYYPGMERYVAYLDSRSKDCIVSHGLGDWYDIGPNPPGVAQLTPLPLTATAFYYYDTWILAQTAVLLGKTNDASRYFDLAARIRTAFNRTFFDPAKGCYATGSQCANSLPLVMNLAEDPQRGVLLEHVVNDIRNRGNALTAGDVGYRFLLRALADGGRSDVIFDVNNQSAKPGYGYQLNQGATSLTEAWDAGRGSSQNHFMLGQIVEWFYHDLAGIRSDPAGPGFKKLIIKPAVVGDITWVKAAYESIHGPIGCQWSREGRRFTLDIAVPPNTSATVWVPAGSERDVTEGRKPVKGNKLVTLLRFEDGAGVYAVDSGNYKFQSLLKGP